MHPIARNHHFIPEFFLAAFTPSGTKDDLLWVTDMKEHKGYPAKPHNVGFQKDLYRIDIDEAPPDAIEQIRGWFEGYAAPAVKYVLENRELPPRPELDHLMELVGVLIVLVPATRERVEKILDKRMKAMFRPYYTDPEAMRADFDKMRDEGIDVPESPDCEELARFASNEDLYTLSVDKEWMLVRMIEASMHAQRMLFKRHWSVLVAEEGAGEFICSDAPVCLTWTNSGRHERIPRLYEHETTVTIPLGQAVALRGQYEAIEPRRASCDLSMVGHLNTRTIGSADRFLYSGGRCFPWERDDGSIGDWDGLTADLESLGRKQKG